MKRRIAISTLALFVSMVAPGPTHAGTPVPNQCFVSHYLHLEPPFRMTGTPYGPGPAFVVSIADGSGALINEPIEIRFGNCAGWGPCDHALFFGSVDCPNGKIVMDSGSTGTQAFELLGGGPGIKNAFPSDGCVEVWAGTPLILVGTTSIIAPDMDGGGGLGANDLSLWLDAFGISTVGDYDESGGSTANDLSQWLDYLGSADYTTSCAPICP